MKITLIGGSQGTGAELASLAQQAGHEVTVVSRSGTPVAGARVITGDATELSTAVEAVTGADAVVITVGGAKGKDLQRTAVTRSIVSAMEAAGTKRLLVQSSLGAGGSASQLPRFAGFVTTLILAKPLADHNQQEAVVHGSSLDWTIVRPTGLTNKEPIERWTALETTDDGILTGSIPRRDLAAFMLQSLEDDTTIGKALGISRPSTPES